MRNWGSTRRRRSTSQPRAVRRRNVRARRGIKARDRQFPLRPAGSGAAQARQGGRLHRDLVGDHREGGDLARGDGADVIIAQGAEAGGHRGMFLTENIAEQPGTFALVPQVVDAVKVPVIAAGGVADGRGIAGACALGAAGVQIGTAYLRCPESKVIAPARTALAQARDDSTVITNVM